MKIGLLTSFRWKQEYKGLFEQMVAYFTQKGHEVVTSDVSIEELHPLGYVQREAIFMRYYEKLEKCDVVFAECTLQSTQVGFGLSHLRSKGKAIIILSLKTVTELYLKGEVYSNVENLAVFEYSESDLKDVLSLALSTLEEHMDKRFTIIFPADLMAKVEEAARKKHLPKAVYIRELLEEDLKNA